MSAITTASVAHDRLTRDTSDDRKSYLARDPSDDRKSYLPRDTGDDRKGYLALALTPSDTSIDDSVKSGYHLKHMPHKQSGTNHNDITMHTYNVILTQVFQGGE